MPPPKPGGATCPRSTSASMPTTQREEMRGMTIDASDRARVLVEALPCIKRFHGQKVVIKLGGHAMDRKDETLLDIVLLRYVGLLPVLVHGRGPQITAKR